MDAHELVLLRAQLLDERAERVDRALAPRSVAERRAERKQQQLLLAIEEKILLARKVVEHRHLRDLRGGRDLLERDRVEAATDEQRGGHVGDPLSGLSLLALPSLAHCQE